MANMKDLLIGWAYVLYAIVATSLAGIIWMMQEFERYAPIIESICWLLACATILSLGVTMLIHAAASDL